MGPTVAPPHALRLWEGFLIHAPGRISFFLSSAINAANAFGHYACSLPARRRGGTPLLNCQQRSWPGGGAPSNGPSPPASAPPTAPWSWPAQVHGPTPSATPAAHTTAHAPHEPTSSHPPECPHPQEIADGPVGSSPITPSPVLSDTSPKDTAPALEATLHPFFLLGILQSASTGVELAWTGWPPLC